MDKLKMIIPLLFAFALIIGSAYATSCSPDWMGGTCSGNTIYDRSTTLYANVSMNGNLVVNPGVTLTTNGFNLFIGGNFIYSGTIMTGNTAGIGSNPGISYINSFGGGGGGGGSGTNGGAGANGGNTLANAGVGATIASHMGGNGATPSIPIITSANIVTWYNGDIQNYLNGGGGGLGASSCGGGMAGTGANVVYGLYVQAYAITSNSGTILANGIQGNPLISTGCGDGGGSGGSYVILAYGNGGFTAGVNSITGGLGGTGETGTGGTGGNGGVNTFSYGSTPPISMPLIVSCQNNWLGGECQGNIYYTQSTSLMDADVNATGSLTINAGVTLVSNGFEIYVGNTFTDNGVIFTGNVLGTGGSYYCSGSSQPAPTNELSSYAGSGGGGGGGQTGGCDGAIGVNGGNTLANAGLGATFQANGGNGATPSAPVMTNANILTWFNAGFQNYLASASGGGGGGHTGGNGGIGGNTVNGIYIQANSIIFNGLVAENIVANGIKGSNGAANGQTGGGGGAGGAAIFLAYNSVYISGNYLYTGGVGGADFTTGGTGGAGQVATFQYITQPILTSPAATYATPSSPTLSLSNTLIDQGQSILFSAGVSNGNVLFSYNYLVVNSIKPATIIANMLHTGILSQSDTWTWTPANALYTANTFKANVIITETGGYSNSVNTIYTPIGYNSMPTITINTISNTLLDSGQYTTFTVTETGGTGATFNAELYNVTGAKQQGSNVLITALSGSNTITIQASSPSNNNGFTFNWIVSDLGDTSPYVFTSTSNAITVNAVLGTPTLSASLTPNAVTGQTEVFTASFTGGTSSYTYNFQVVNDITPTKLLANMLIANGFTQNTFSWVVPAADAVNSFKANVIITDSATTKVIANSVYIANVFITTTYSTPPTPTLTFSNVLIDQSQSTVLTATVTGGSTPYTYNFLIVNSITPSTVLANMLLINDNNLQETWVYTPTSTTLGNTLEANVIITDAHPTTVNSVYNAMGYNAILTSPTLSPLSASLTNPPATETWTANGFTGGTPPYTYKWSVYNPFGGLLTSTTYASNQYASNSFSYTFIVTGSNPYTVNVLISDAASTNMIFNSILSSISVQTGSSGGGGGGGGGGFTIPSVNTSQIVNVTTKIVTQSLPLLSSIQLEFSSFVLAIFFQPITYATQLFGSGAPNATIYSYIFILALLFGAYGVARYKKAKSAKIYIGTFIIISIMLVAYAYVFITPLP